MSLLRKKQNEIAFSKLIPYIDTEIITKKVPQYVSHLKALYKEQYKELWGADDENIEDYLSQVFIRNQINKETFCTLKVLAVMMQSCG